MRVVGVWGKVNGRMGREGGKNGGTGMPIGFCRDAGTSSSAR